MDERDIYEMVLKNKLSSTIMCERYEKTKTKSLEMVVVGLDMFFDVLIDEDLINRYEQSMLYSAIKDYLDL